MQLQFFDFEVLPHWWLCVLGTAPGGKVDDDSIKDSFIVITSDMPNAREQLLEYIKTDGVCNVGYNIKHYDLIILNAIYQGFSPEQVHIINDLIIRPDCKYDSKEHLRLFPFASKRMKGIVYQDMIDDNTGSLKEKESSLGLSILESSVPFTKEDLTQQDKDDLIYYCKQDVYALMWYTYNHLDAKSYLETKLQIGETFGIDEATCYACTNPNLISKVLHAHRRSFYDSDLEIIEIPATIDSYIRDNLPKSVIAHLTTSKDSYDTALFNNSVTFGNGGLHSVYAKNLIVKSTDEYGLYLIDVSSFYPSILVNYDCLSRAVEDPQLYRRLYEKRLEIKNKPHATKEEKVLANSYKLVLNSTYGASGCKWLDLYDPYQTTRTCRIGQMLLAALCCQLTKEISDLTIIQSNTDGIMVYVKRSMYDEMMRLCNKWTQMCKMQVEITEADSLWQKDVNNYILKRIDGTIKNKGGWLRTSYQSGGVALAPLNCYICAKAVLANLLDGTPITTTIGECTDLGDLVMSCSKGPTFFKMIQRLGNGMEVDLFNSNRVLPVTDPSLGMLYKVKRRNGVISYNQVPNCPEHCMILNADLRTYDFNELKPKIDYMYYLNRCFDLLDVCDDVKASRRDKWLELVNENQIQIDLLDYV